MVKTAMGDDKFIGSKNPRITTKRNEENEKDPVKQYLHSKKNEKQDEMEDLNPTGFHEMAWSVSGIQYSMFHHSTLKSNERKAVKVVSQGLAKTDPGYVDRVIYCSRNPRCVAKSQERLRGHFGPAGNPTVDGIKETIHTPEMYIQTTIMAAKWFILNNDVPVLIVDYDQIHTETQVTVDKIGAFIGEGNWSNVSSVVDSKLNRSKPENIENSMWYIADEIYRLTLEKRWNDIVAIQSQFRVEKNAEIKKIGRMRCTRLNATVTTFQCNACRTCPHTRKNFRNNARGDWGSEPCLRDVQEGKCTVQESIANHSWK